MNRTVLILMICAAWIALMLYLITTLDPNVVCSTSQPC